MQTFKHLFTAGLLFAIAGFVGCADTKTPEKTEKSPAADHSDHDGDHSHDQDKTPEKTPMKTPADEGGEVPTPATNPDVEPANDAESGSTENKGGVEIRE